MTLQLRLYDDEGNEAALPIGVLGGPVGGWSLQSAPVRAQSLMPYAVHDGPAVHERTRDLVSETVEVWIPKQASSYDLRAKVQAIETLLEKANRGGEVWVEYNTGEASDNLWRSPLMAGGLAWGPDMRLRWRNWEAHARVHLLARTVVAGRQPHGAAGERVDAGERERADGRAGGPGDGARVERGGRAASPVQPDVDAAKQRRLSTCAFTRRRSTTRRPATPGLYTVASSIARTNLTPKTQSQILAAAMPSARRAAGGECWSKPRARARCETPTATRRCGYGPGRARRPNWSNAARGPGPDTTKDGRADSAIWEHFTWRAATFTSWHTPTARCRRRRCGYTCCRPTATAPTFMAGDSPTSGTLVDDGGELSGTAAGAGMADGEPLLLTPGRASELFVLMEDGAGDSPGDMTLAAAYRPRRLSI